MGNGLLLGPAYTNLDEFQVSAISVWAADTTASILLTEANTALDIVYKFSYMVGNNPEWSSPNSLSLTHPIKVGNLKSPVITAGTAFIYLA